MNSSIIIFSGAGGSTIYLNYTSYMPVEIVAFLIISFIGLYVCITDYTQRRINNNAVLCVFILLSAIAIFHDKYISGLVLAISVIFIGYVLFVVKVLGAGDVKLVAAFAPALTWSGVVVGLFGMCVLGGLLAAGYLLYGVCSGRLKEVRQRGIPYGIPIVISFLTVLYFQLDIGNQFQSLMM
ncbi:A24 family peptidase [Dongshaea marina]|uniref:A24 family peptidase n=1 Tax=Dongshaea marina TaxID=2047966 RepID=UPI00131F3844|nr:prepilin peptidase [Dongshaea marina]